VARIAAGRVALSRTASGHNMDQDSDNVRVGIDVVAVEEVMASLATFGDKYVGRLFTEHEVASCRGAMPVVAAGLAARFAAKEATIKVLRPTGHQPDWRSMEVRRNPSGWCTMQLTDEAARMAREQRIGDMGVSLTHDHGIAAAVVVALLDEGRRATGSHQDDHRHGEAEGAEDKRENRDGG
jgi:holo-[acyl-carrier protein] synthase